MSEPDPQELADAWARLADDLGAPADASAALFDELQARHREPHRRYHTLEHLQDALAAVDELADLAADPDAVRLAVWFHDAVYEPGDPQSEERSALLARDRLTELGMPPDRVDHVADLVRMTAGHDPGTEPDAIVLADADLWILGAPTDRYRRYTDDVRREYRHLADHQWQAGRRAVLLELLGRPRLYRTDRFHDRFEARARENLAHELAQLTEI